MDNTHPRSEESNEDLGSYENVADISSHRATFAWDKANGDGVGSGAAHAGWRRVDGPLVTEAFRASAQVLKDACFAG
jgi:hypothetical protein